MVALLVSWIWWNCQGLTGLCPDPGEGIPGWAAPGAAVVLCKEAEAGALFAWDAELRSTRRKLQALPQAELGFLALGISLSGFLEALCCPLLGSGGLCWATSRALRQCHRLSSVRV